MRSGQGNPYGLARGGDVGDDDLGRRRRPDRVELVDPGELLLAFIECGLILYIKLQSERGAVAGRR